MPITHASDHESRNERHVAAESIKSGDHHGAFSPLCSCERIGQPQPAIQGIGSLAGLDELFNHLKTFGLNKMSYGSSLCFQAEAATLLSSGGDAEMPADIRNLDRVRLNHLARHEGSIFTGGAGDHKRIGPPCRRVAASSVRCWPNDHDAVQFGDLNVLPQFSHRRGNVEVRLLTECAFGQKSGPGPSVRSVNSAPPAPVRAGEMSKSSPHRHVEVLPRRLEGVKTGAFRDGQNAQFRGHRAA